jgi:putative transcriptional regulator|tara:strand:- start:410 stop:1024 length:615 start_codon:yes stop_codon:yes gene_type:complete
VSLVLLFNLHVSVQALDSAKSYLKGKFYQSVEDNFLVATEEMKDLRFANTVIVILKNDKNETFGLVINKPLGSIPLSSLINKAEDQNSKQNELYNVKVPVYWGGPVDENRILILHSKEYKSENTKNYKEISVTSGYKILLEIADKKGPKKSLILIGYSGWGSGQLEGEMERGGWVLSELNTDLIFEIDNANKWLNAINNSFIRL